MKEIITSREFSENSNDYSNNINANVTLHPVIKTVLGVGVIFLCCSFYFDISIGDIINIKNGGHQPPIKAGSMVITDTDFDDEDVNYDLFDEIELDPYRAISIANDFRVRETPEIDGDNVVGKINSGVDMKVFARSRHKTSVQFRNDYVADYWYKVRVKVRDKGIVIAWIHGVGIKRISSLGDSGSIENPDGENSNLEKFTPHMQHESRGLMVEISLKGKLRDRKINQVLRLKNGARVGKAIFKICVDETGKVIGARFSKKQSTIKDKDFISYLEQWAEEELTLNASKSASEDCDTIEIKIMPKM